MKTMTGLCVAGLCALLVVGCSNRSEELQQQLADVQAERDGLRGQIAERDAYFEEVLNTVNQVHADLEKARRKESQLVEQAGDVEGKMQFTSAEVRQQMLQKIGSIGESLKESRKRISALQAKGRALGKEIEGLNTLIAGLRKSLEEREQSIAMLQTQVQGLEATVAEKVKEIGEKSAFIEQQQRTMNTAYYIVGTREELEQKGVITEEGGWLFGWGSTTLLASGVDRSLFTPIDKGTGEVIDIAGEVNEIVPRRDEGFYAMTPAEGGASALRITTPEKFWQDNFLVIVLN